MKTHFRLPGIPNQKTPCGRDIPSPLSVKWYSLLTTSDAGKVTCLRCLRYLKRRSNRLLGSELVHLHINTLRGSSFGAIHWYSELQLDDKEGELLIVELKHPLTQREAVELNQSDGFHLVDYNAGQDYSGFWSHDKALKAGVDQWKKVCPDGKVLVLGQHMYSEPMPVVDTIYDGDQALKDAAAEIVKSCEAIGWFDNPKNDDLMDQYILQWEVLLQTFVKEQV